MIKPVITEADPAREERRQAAEKRLRELSASWVENATVSKYVYNFSWLGVPMIQLPQDVMAMQELVWRVQPDLVVETGVAHGGSLIFYASMLKLIGGQRRVIGVDVDIRPANRQAIERHPLAAMITLIQGSSVDPEVAATIIRLAGQASNPLVVLDSNHTHEHVLRELELYSGLVRKSSYLVVFDTVIEDLPEATFANRPWGRGNNPKTAVRDFLKQNSRFEVDDDFDRRMILTAAPQGFLRCVA